MKVLHQDAREGVIRVRPDSLDDLWTLQQLVERGDVAKALTFRAPEEAKTDAARQGKVEKRPMVLGVRVEDVEFHEFANRLRILGIIVEGPQDHSQHHTLNIEAHTELEVRKPRWKDHHLQMLKEAVEATAKPLVVLLAIEENEAVVAALRQYGVAKLADIAGHVSGKRYAQDGRADEAAFFDEVLMALRDYRKEGQPLVVLGPGFAKERFLAYARGKEPEHVKGAAVEATGQAGMTGIHEAIKRGVVDRVQKDSRVAKDTHTVERVLEAMAKDDPVAYGPREVEHALDSGAVELLLVTDRLVRDGKADAWLTKAKGTGAEAHIVSTSHEAGQKLENLTGVAALLRFRLG
ncbi:MAG TPA: mRNA surveillance protein pelota [Candidatus Thermoplasmatota archaeon]|nr:mRNA surveillance protein pelota [Candidatus Thermoplasmatota archaeon]